MIAFHEFKTNVIHKKIFIWITQWFGSEIWPMSDVALQPFSQSVHFKRKEGHFFITDFRVSYAISTLSYTNLVKVMIGCFNQNQTSARWMNFYNLSFIQKQRGMLGRLPSQRFVWCQSNSSHTGVKCRSTCHHLCFLHSSQRGNVWATVTMELQAVQISQIWDGNYRRESKMQPQQKLGDIFDRDFRDRSRWFILYKLLFCMCGHRSTQPGFPDVLGYRTQVSLPLRLFDLNWF